ncbi:uncharacterized protein EV422DRAFT_528001 [Fimicolochytrium jonesii]|uniref:uncharacterized protein n=1 Tax=Fimicolochytrium jonesii TaxID=1396493 RepID=UPI0022FE83E5|nr:uncharacterized protein EV422DRAFT_528001 [Fimicolochytrium jonesii]KAI8821393.1 hypothetical protein EV422DRAFT_528001 [Fimicolochytrium jonesii]
MLRDMSDEDVPPLEDMTEEVARMEKVRQRSAVPERSDPTANEEFLIEVAKPEVEHLASQVKPKTQQSKTQPTKTDKSFGGLKKGFFSSSPRSGASRAADPPRPNIPVIKPKAPAADGLRFDEVQQAMRSQMSMLDKQEWLTPAFLERIEKSPHLARALADPAFQQAAAEMSKNPQAAFKKYAVQRPDLLQALREFAGMLGESLTSIAETQDARQ